MAAEAPRSFAFVPADAFGVLKASDRKVVRSQCMRGKNKRKAAHASTLSPPSAGHDVFQATQSALLSNSAPMSFRSRHSRDSPLWDAETVDGEAGFAGELREAAERESFFPPPPPADLSLVKFAGEVNGDSRELLFKFFNVARNIAYPVDFGVDFDLSRTIWFQWLSDDVAYLHSVLLSTSVIHDFLTRRTPAKTTYFHLRKTIAFLNEHLSDSAVSLRDSTVAVVVTLASLADVFGDYTAAKAHVAGLQQMVRLRGGLGGFRGNTKLHIKIRRLDLSLSLNTGEPPRFFTDPVSWEPIFASSLSVPMATGHECFRHVQIVDSLRDSRLVAIFRDLQYFAGLMNAATGKNRRLQDTEFDSITCSIQYRLLHLQRKLDESLDECVRLAMLAFLTTTYPSPGKRIRYPYLARRFREYCSVIHVAPPLSQDLMLWLLTVGAISVYGVHELWLRERWQVDVPDLVWPGARRRLQEIMWINAIHDKPGECAFESVSHRRVV